MSKKTSKGWCERNPEAYRASRERGKAAYYGPTSGIWPARAWTPAEDEAVLAREESDRELAARLHRSVSAIESRRSRLRKQGLKG